MWRARLIAMSCVGVSSEGGGHGPPTYLAAPFWSCHIQVTDTRIAGVVEHACTELWGNASSVGARSDR